MPLPLIESSPSAVPLWPVTEAGLADWLKGQPPATAAWVQGAGFTGAAGRILPVPGTAGRPAGMLVGVSATPDLWSLAGMPDALPAGDYRLESPWPPHLLTQAALGWALGAYEFGRYRKPRPQGPARLVWPEGCDRTLVERLAGAILLARDLINTPAGDMGPAELAEACINQARRFGATASVIVGDDLLAQNYPMIHAVGRASTRPPRLVDITWGAADAPKLTLVGKGVCFDSGGLDLKTAAGMALMKKDMGGAATMLALATAIMDAGLPLRLRLLVPAVENAVAGNAVRPGDVLPSRKGLSVEIGNTDAEGRLILADALAAADVEQPALLIDAATLTGAARVALGPDLPALFTPDDQLAADIARHGAAQVDAMWRLPLHGPYRRMLDSKIADINNSAEGSFAGAITAALFLKEFVGATKTWAHIDLHAWNTKSLPGRPIGGEAMGLRALYALIAERFGKR